MADPIKRQLDWFWIGVGLLLIVAGNLVLYTLAGTQIRGLVAEDRVVMAFVLAGGLPLFVYFLTGVIVGRMSADRTVQEPAVAALLGVVVVAVLQYFAGMVNVFGVIFGAPACYAVAYLGGWIGERWQEWSERRAGKHP